MPYASCCQLRVVPAYGKVVALSLHSLETDLMEEHHHFVYLGDSAKTTVKLMPGVYGALSRRPARARAEGLWV